MNDKNNVKHQKCINCLKIKSIDEFYRRKDSQTGYHNQCKECISKKYKKWRKDNTEKLKKYRKEYKKNNPEKVKEGKRKEYLKNREKYINRSKKYYEKLKKELGYYPLKLISEQRRFGGNRIKVLERDNYTCQKCDSKKLICVHHVDGTGRGSKIHNNNLDNLITLCRNCHTKIHKPREGTGKNN